MTKVIINQNDLQDELMQHRRDGATISLVPTMGALHDGHLALVKKAKELSEVVVVSIFVNPKQFGPGEDFAQYPRTLEQDIAALKTVNADYAFVPNTAEIFPEHFQTYVENTDLAHQLCGRFRPSHFRGVLTVVLKLIHIVKPRYAIFGKKDYQQWQLIKRMCHDLNVAIEIIPCNIVREPDGLAMSSRNKYLDKEQREIASKIYHALKKAQEAYGGGARQCSELLSIIQHEWQATPEIQTEYCEIWSSELTRQFRNEDVVDAPAVILAAVRLGQTRLIDNIELNN